MDCSAGRLGACRLLVTCSTLTLSLDAPIHLVKKSAGMARSGTWPIVISCERTRCSRTWYRRKKCFERDGTAAPDATRWLAVLSVPMNVGALNRNCQLGAGRVRLWKRLGVQGAPPNSPYATAPICHVSAHVLVTGASFAATGSTQLRARRVLHLLATAAHRREALEQLRAMSGMRAHDHAVLRAPSGSETAAAPHGACLVKKC